LTLRLNFSKAINKFISVSVSVIWSLDQPMCFGSSVIEQQICML